MSKIPDDWFGRVTSDGIVVMSCGLLLANVPLDIWWHNIPLEWLCEVELVMLGVFLLSQQVYRPLLHNWKHAALLGIALLFIAPIMIGVIIVYLPLI